MPRNFCDTERTMYQPFNPKFLHFSNDIPFIFDFAPVGKISHYIIKRRIVAFIYYQPDVSRTGFKLSKERGKIDYWRRRSSNLARHDVLSASYFMTTFQTRKFIFDELYISRILSQPAWKRRNLSFYVWLKFTKFIAFVINVKQFELDLTPNDSRGEFSF